MRYPKQFLRRTLASLLWASLCAAVCALGVAAQQPEATQRKVEDPIGVAEEQRQARRQPAQEPQRINIALPPKATQARDVTIDAEKSEIQGSIIIYTGNVQVSDGEVLIIADRIIYNNNTEDATAEGNVFFEHQGQRIAGERIEFNYKTRRGSIFNSTTFTNQTPDGTTLLIDANRADKTGTDTYTVEDATLTACQEEVPKWSFTAKRARIRLDHRAQIYNAFFRVKGLPVLWLPYASISISKKDRASGFLLPSTGSSTIKGRTFRAAYYQTLGRSADILFRTDIYSKRGIGFGFDFRARTDENSKIDFGSFVVLDRLLGEKEKPGVPNQGGSSFYADAVQHFKNGFIAVADVNITSSFEFRQVFSENILTAISPEERSIFYLNKNWRSFSFNAFFGEQSSFVANDIVKVRQLPSIGLTQRSTQVSEHLPFYFSFDAALEGVRRSEVSGAQVNLKTPSIVQRFDLAPRLTFPLKPFAGFTLTPSVGVSSTFYSDSLDPVQRQVTGQNLLRNYADISLDLRPPSLYKVFKHRDGTPWFKHVIEPFVEYRRIAGIDDFDRTLKVDERDLVADTNEVTYGVSNKFFVKRQAADGGAPQTHELLDVTIAQKFFVDPSFGGALREGVRNQFFPINTLSGFSYGGVRRDFSPLNLTARLRPVQSLFADVRLDYDTEFHGLRNLVVGAGVTKGIFSFSESWYFTRRIDVGRLLPNGSRFDPTALPGNQLDLSGFVGNVARGPYGGVSISYDLRDQTFAGAPRDPRFMGLTSTAGWAWDCCSLNVNHFVYNIGVRNESRLIFAFTLKGIGSFGTQNLGQRRR